MIYFGNDYDTDHPSPPIAKAAPKVRYSATFVKTPRIMPFWLALILIPLSAVGAVIAEAGLIAWCAISATWETLIVGNEKSAVRRRFK